MRNAAANTYTRAKCTPQSVRPFGPYNSHMIRDKLWQRHAVAEAGHPQPAFAAVTGARLDATGQPLGAALLAAPGRSILKPRFGSNGVAVVRIVSANGALSVETDCPDTARYLDEFPADPRRHGADVVEAVARHRDRFLDRALAGIPERALDLSILEDEIPPHRADGSLFEPRVVAQRADGGRFAILGAICKRIDTAVGASVARDFREVPLEDALGVFLRDRVQLPDLAVLVERTRAGILVAAERLCERIVPLVEASGARVHQFGIDGRLCWNATAGRAEWPFLEFQFGIGRVDVPLAGYQTRAELAAQFGPECG